MSLKTSSMTRPKPYCPSLCPLPIDPLNDGPCDSCDTRRLLNPLTGIWDTPRTALDYRYASPNGESLPFGTEGNLSFSRSTANSSLLTANSSYTFSAKEKDSETGLSYFGSRYYSSDLSIWLSVDPQASKYPSLSPYVYCANNPVKLVDPNGEEIVNVYKDAYEYVFKQYSEAKKIGKHLRETERLKDIKRLVRNIKMPKGHMMIYLINIT